MQRVKETKGNYPHFINIIILNKNNRGNGVGEVQTSVLRGLQTSDELFSLEENNLKRVRCIIGCKFSKVEVE